MTTNELSLSRERGVTGDQQPELRAHVEQEGRLLHITIVLRRETSFWRGRVIILTQPAGVMSSWTRCIGCNCPKISRNRGDDNSRSYVWTVLEPILHLVPVRSGKRSKNCKSRLLNRAWCCNLLRTKERIEFETLLLRFFSRVRVASSFVMLTINWSCSLFRGSLILCNFQINLASSPLAHFRGIYIKLEKCEKFDIFSAFLDPFSCFSCQIFSLHEMISHLPICFSLQRLISTLPLDWEDTEWSACSGLR